jgi:hypothetical protein
VDQLLFLLLLPLNRSMTEGHHGDTTKATLGKLEWAKAAAKSRKQSKRGQRKRKEAEGGTKGTLQSMRIGMTIGKTT